MVADPSMAVSLVKHVVPRKIQFTDPDATPAVDKNVQTDVNDGPRKTDTDARTIIKLQR